MRVNLDWLRDWVELDGNVESIAADLTTAGLEVDAVERTTASIENVVVAEVLRVERHPNADRLSVCVVADGAGAARDRCGLRGVSCRLTCGRSWTYTSSFGSILTPGVYRVTPGR